MVALEEGLLDLDAEVRDGFTLRHLLSHCAGLPEPGAALAGAARVSARVRSAGTRTPATCRRRRLLEGAAGMSCAAYLQRGRARAARDGRLARAPRARRGRARPASGSPVATARASCSTRSASARDAPPQGGAFATARAYGSVPLLPAGAAATPPAARCSRRRPSRRCSRRSSGRCRAASKAWASGRISAGASASTCAGGASRTGRARRSARAAPATSAPRGRSPGSTPSAGLGLVALANRGSYSGWWREPWAALGSAVTAAAAAA